MTEPEFAMSFLCLLLICIAAAFSLFGYVLYDSGRKRPVAVRRYRAVSAFVVLGMILLISGVIGMFLIRSHERGNLERLERERQQEYEHKKELNL